MPTATRGAASDRSDSPDADSSGLDHHEVAPDLVFPQRLHSSKNLLVKSTVRNLVRKMCDYDAGMTPWRVRQDVRETTVSRNQHRATLLSCLGDGKIRVTTQTNIPHIEGIMPCRTKYLGQRAGQVLVDEKPHRRFPG